MLDYHRTEQIAQDKVLKINIYIIKSGAGFKTNLYSLYHGSYINHEELVQFMKDGYGFHFCPKIDPLKREKVFGIDDEGKIIAYVFKSALLSQIKASEPNDGDTNLLHRVIRAGEFLDYIRQLENNGRPKIDFRERRD